MKRTAWLFVIFLAVSANIFAQFYAQSPVCEFEVDFSDLFGGLLTYYGYRPSENEFVKAITGGYFQYQVDPPETLIPQSYYSVENNTALDGRIKDAMRKNKITMCETFYANDYGGFTYVVNYSFDNYATFGFISMDSSGYETNSAQSTSNTPKYGIVTGYANYRSISESELQKRLNIQDYSEIVSWLRRNSHNVVESHDIPEDRLLRVLATTSKQSRKDAENTANNLPQKGSQYDVWFKDSSGYVTEWIVYYKQDN